MTPKLIPGEMKRNRVENSVFAASTDNITHLQHGDASLRRSDSTCKFPSFRTHTVSGRPPSLIHLAGRVLVAAGMSAFMAEEAKLAFGRGDVSGLNSPPRREGRVRYQMGKVVWGRAPILCPLRQISHGFSLLYSLESRRKQNEVQALIVKRTRFICRHLH